MVSFDEEQLAAVRKMVNQAVESEVAANQRNKSFIDKMDFDMLKRDFQSMSSTVSDLKEVVLGNDSLGQTGLIKQVKSINDSLHELNEKINKWTNEVEGFRKALWVFSALIGISGLAGIQALLKGFGVLP